MLIMLEGCDGSGKSTLARELSSWLGGASVVHHGPYKGVSGQDLAATYMASLRPALAGQHLVLDRGWLSEPVYSGVYRHEPSRIDSAHKRMLERAALSVRGVVVYCEPPYETCRDAFFSGREELLDSEAQLRQVYDQYTRGPDTALPVVTYDRTTTTVAELIAEIKEVLHFYDDGVTHVLLGDRPNVRTHAQSALQVPFVSFTGLGCSRWLAEQLDSAGISESRLRWFNTADSQGRPLSVAQLPEGQYKLVALGSQAGQWCRSQGLIHHLVPHPQAHKRFHNHLPYALLEVLRAGIW